jgi:hypothetical protein
MSGFESLESAIELSDALSPITAEEAVFADEEMSDRTALGLVLQDIASFGEKYLQSKGLTIAMEQADDLVRAYVRPRQWPGTDKPKANLGMPVVMEAIETILPTLHTSLFSGKVPFNITPLGKTTPEAARAKGKLLVWAIRQADFKEEIRRTLKTTLTYGFAVGQWGWKQADIRKKVYERQPDGSVKARIETERISHPTYECLDLRQVLVDPALKVQDVRKGGYVIKQNFCTANDLDDLRDNDDYKNIPTREELKEILASKSEPTSESLRAEKSNTYRELQAAPEADPSTVDPLQQPLEILERWDNGRVITVLQRKIVIRNQENEFGRLNFNSVAFIDVLNSAWGFGIARLLSGEQRLQQAVVNSWIDQLALVLNPVYQLLKGIGPGTQNITVSPGKVVTVSGELKPLLTPDVTNPAMEAISTSEERANRRVGANTASNMPTQALRTGTGIQAYTGDVMQRLQYFMEIFIDLVFIPVLEAFMELMCDHLTPGQINSILSEEDGKEFAGELLDVYNATCGIEVLAGADLMAKQAAAQLVPLIMQLVAQQPVHDSLTQQGKKFDYQELISQALDLMGWDVGSLIVPMTAEDTQRAQQMNGAAVKAQADAQLEAQKHQNDLENIDAKGTAQAGVAVIRSIVKGHETEAQNLLENLNGQQQ